MCEGKEERDPSLSNQTSIKGPFNLVPIAWRCSVTRLGKQAESRVKPGWLDDDDDDGGDWWRPHSHVTQRATIIAQSQSELIPVHTLEVRNRTSEAIGSRETRELQVPDRCSPAAQTMSFTAFQVRVRQRPGVRSQERQWWEMFPRSQEQRAQCGEGSLRRTFRSGEFFSKAGRQVARVQAQTGRRWERFFSWK